MLSVMKGRQLENYQRKQRSLKMKVMHSEWSGRIRHWIRTLKDDFYEPLGEFRWEGHRTMEHISPEQALGLAFEQVQPGFTWGNTYEYCWFRSRI